MQLKAALVSTLPSLWIKALPPASAIARPSGVSAIHGIARFQGSQQSFPESDLGRRRAVLDIYTFGDEIDMFGYIRGTAAYTIQGTTNEDAMHPHL